MSLPLKGRAKFTRRSATKQDSCITLIDVMRSPKKLDISFIARYSLAKNDPSLLERSSMMANDPGLAADTCIFLEAISGDGGNQNPNDVWWLSPDIALTGHTSGPENADAGTNQITIRFHRKPAGTCNFPGDESITVEAWVANPSLVMAPHLRGSAARVGRQLWATTGLAPRDIDAFFCYDFFTSFVIMALEDYGFCPRGEGGPFVTGGAPATDSNDAW
jgi:hypothetical protein